MVGSAPPGFPQQVMFLGSGRCRYSSHARAIHRADYADKAKPKPKPTKFSVKASGKVQFSASNSCPTGDQCFLLTGTLTTTGATVTLDAVGMYNPTECTTTKAKGNCCNDTVTGTAAVTLSGTPYGTLDFNFTGPFCQKKPPNGSAKMTNAVLAVTGGSGQFQGALGTGKVTLSENPVTLAGSATVSGKGTLP